MVWFGILQSNSTDIEMAAILDKSNSTDTAGGHLG